MATIESDEEMAEKLAPMRPQVYKDPRPVEYFTRFHERARTREPDWVYDLCRLLATPYVMALFRASAIGVENVPTSGPVIIAPNHFSFIDHFFLGCFTRRKVCFMAKSQLFSKPMQTIYTHGGVFPVRRGYQDSEAFTTAHTILGRGGCLGMYCEGGRSRTGKLSERPRRGIGRLALESGAWVVPAAIYGSSRVRNWKRLQFPRITIQYGKPIRWDKIPDPTNDQQQAVADEIFSHVRVLYSGLEELGVAGARRKARESEKRDN